MAKLTQKERDALPAGDFAVPGKRELPMHDREHVKLAWDMVERTKGLTPDEKRTARKRILERAKKFGIDTKDWKKEQAGQRYGPVHIVRRIEAMALDMPEVTDHPNRAPFSGVLVLLDEPSDYAVGGAGGHRTIIPSDVAESGIPSLLGMALDFKPDFDGHDPQSKIGIITAGEVVDNELQVRGFFYEKNFPEIIEFIRENKELLGLSYEADVVIRDIGEDPWQIDEITFTGAAVLYKADAAYTKTSLAAAAAVEKEKIEMEELKKLIAQLEERMKKLEAAGTTVAANKDLIDRVHPHAEACRGCAEAMRAAGIGMHPTRGHVAVLHRIAHHMETEAASGRVPHEIPGRIFHDTDYFYAQADYGSPDGETVKAIQALRKDMAEIGTKINDLQAESFKAAANPGRKTITPEIAALLNRTGLTAQIDKGELSVEIVDRTLEAAGIKGRAAIEAKLKLVEGGFLAGQAAN